MKFFASSTEDYYDNGMRDYPVAVRAGYAVILGILYAFCKVMWRCDFDKIELIADRRDDTGTVIISNHTSMAEVVAIVTYLWRRGRLVRRSSNRSSTRRASCAGSLHAWAASPSTAARPT